MKKRPYWWPQSSSRYPSHLHGVNSHSLQASGTLCSLSPELTLLAAFLACVMSCRIRTMFSDTVAFLFFLFSRLLSFSSSSGIVLSRLDTGVGEEKVGLKVSEEGGCKDQAVLRQPSRLSTHQISWRPGLPGSGLHFEGLHTGLSTHPDSSSWCSEYLPLLQLFHWPQQLLLWHSGSSLLCPLERKQKSLWDCQEPEGSTL